MTPEQPVLSDLEALYAAILSQPEEDTPRLIYADALDERGQPGGADRAEFIRVQVEMNRCDWHQPVHWAKLNDRSDALLDAHRTEWLRVKCPECDGVGHHWEKDHVPYGDRHKVDCPDCRGTGDAGGLTWRFGYTRGHAGGVGTAYEPVRVEFVRGFPHKVRVPGLVDCLHNPGDLAGGYFETTSWLAAVCRHHPIAEVVCLDREPFPDNSVTLGLGIGRGFDWLDRTIPDLPESGSAVVASPIFDIMAADRPNNITPTTGGGRALENLTGEAAITALARAIVEFARQQQEK